MSRSKKKYSTMSFEEHLETAEDIRIARAHLFKARNRVSKYYLKSSVVMKAFEKLVPGNWGALWSKNPDDPKGDLIPNPWTRFKDILDGDFCLVATEDQYKEYGNIYFNGDKSIRKGGK